MMISEDNMNIHGLWIGESLPSLALLTIKSFLYHGHTFNLWSYGDIRTPLPEGCMVRDANEIIPNNKIFRYKGGLFPGSVSGFSDIFRNKLLYEVGGWYVDMDVTCLKPFDIESPYLFVQHHKKSVVQNVMKAPKNSKLMYKIYETLSKEITEDNERWLLPLQISSQIIEDEGFLQYRDTEFAGLDSPKIIRRYLLSGKKFPKNWYVFHWCNHWKDYVFHYDGAIKGSRFEKICTKYNIPMERKSIFHKYGLLLKTTITGLKNKFLRNG